MEWDAHRSHLSTAPVHDIAFLLLAQEIEASLVTWSGRDGAGAGASFRFATHVIHYIAIRNSYYYSNTEKSFWATVNYSVLSSHELCTCTIPQDKLIRSVWNMSGVNKWLTIFLLRRAISWKGPTYAHIERRSIPSKYRHHFLTTTFMILYQSLLTGEVANITATACTCISTWFISEPHIADLARL